MQICGALNRFDVSAILPQAEWWSSFARRDTLDDHSVEEVHRLVAIAICGRIGRYASDSKPDIVNGPRGCRP